MTSNPVYSYTYLYIDSINRNVNSFPNVNRFLVNVDTIKNIKSIELVSIALPGTGIYNQGALVLKLEPDSFNRLNLSTNSNLTKSSFVLFPENTTPTTFSTINVGQTIEFDFNQNIMRQFGMTFYKTDNTLFSFGETAGDLAIDKNIKTLFRLKIEQEENK